jgi:hypothetical protein
MVRVSQTNAVVVEGVLLSLTKQSAWVLQGDDDVFVMLAEVASMVAI